MMQVDLLCLVDAATVDAGGKLNILGAYDGIQLPDFPALTRVVVALRLVGFPIDKGLHHLDVRIVSEDGETIASGPPTVISVEAGPGAHGRFTLPGVLVMAPTFPEPGEYAVDVFVDGLQLRSLELPVTTFRGAAST